MYPLAILIPLGIVIYRERITFYSQNVDIGKNNMKRLPSD